MIVSLKKIVKDTKREQFFKEIHDEIDKIDKYFMKCQSDEDRGFDYYCNMGYRNGLQDACKLVEKYLI